MSMTLVRSESSEDSRSNDVDESSAAPPNAVVYAEWLITRLFCVIGFILISIISVAARLSAWLPTRVPLYVPC